MTKIHIVNSYTLYIKKVHLTLLHGERLGLKIKKIPYYVKSLY